MRVEDRWLVHFPHLWKWCPCNRSNTWGWFCRWGYYRESQAGQGHSFGVTRASEHYSSRRVLHATGFLWSRQSDPSRKWRAWVCQSTECCCGNASPIGYENRGQAKSRDLLVSRSESHWSKQSGRRAWETSSLRVCRKPRASAGWGYGANLGLYPKSSSVSRGSSLWYRWDRHQGQWPSCSRRTRLYRKSS